MNVWSVQEESLLETLPIGASAVAASAEFTPDGGILKQRTLYDCEVCASPAQLLALAQWPAIHQLTPEERVRYLHVETVLQPQLRA